MIQLGCLPYQKDIKEPEKDELAWAIGWGVTDTAFENQFVLFNGHLNISDSSVCQNLMPNVTKDWNSQFCASESDLDHFRQSCHSKSD
jgi:hypothetical protein